MMLHRRFGTLVGLAAFTLLLGAFFFNGHYGFYGSALGVSRPPSAAVEGSQPHPPLSESQPHHAEPEEQKIDEPAHPTTRPSFVQSNTLSTVPSSSNPKSKSLGTSTRPSVPQSTEQKHTDVKWPDELRVSIVESGGSHEEVVAAFTHAFGFQKNVKLSLYLLLKRFGLTELIESFSLPSGLSPIQSSYDFPKLYDDSTIPHVLVATTCELDLIRLDQAIRGLLKAGKTYLFCVVHHADKWAEEDRLQTETSEWIEQARITFLTLSPHTAKYFKSVAIARWELKEYVFVDHLIPVYPVAHNRSIDDLVSGDELAFVMQGDYDARRRDYGSIFSQLEKFVKSPEYSEQNKNLYLHLLGHGSEPLVPASLKEHIAFDSNLDYLDYYAVLDHSFALLPAFATNEYLDRKASSSIPAALIGGTPLVATQAMLDAYSYLTKDVVWFQKEGETDMDVVGRVLQMSPEQRQRTKDAVQQRLATLVKDNIAKAEAWVEDSLRWVVA